MLPKTTTPCRHHYYQLPRSQDCWCPPEGGAGKGVERAGRHDNQRELIAEAAEMIAAAAAAGGGGGAAAAGAAGGGGGEALVVAVGAS
jgi:hypothetical protein